MQLPENPPYLEGDDRYTTFRKLSRDNTDIVFKNVPQTEG